MALDERIAIGYISSSGHGGAKLHRRKYGETIENVANTYYHWMAGNYLKYAGRWDMLPVDSHQLIALCAPRPVFLSAGNGPGPLNGDGTVPVNDAWVDPRAAFSPAWGPALSTGCSAVPTLARRTSRPSIRRSSPATSGSISTLEDTRRNPPGPPSCALPTVTWSTPLPDADRRSDHRPGRQGPLLPDRCPAYGPGV
jgi:hypothetical protein